MINRHILGLFLMAAAGTGCSSDSMVGIGGYCEVDEDCLSISQHLEGTHCESGRCTCNAGEELCCPGGKMENCLPGVRDDYKCRPETECHPPEAPDAGTGGAAGSAGGGGTGMAGAGGAVP